jgi:hypothetical protein
VLKFSGCGCGLAGLVVGRLGIYNLFLSPESHITGAKSIVLSDLKESFVITDKNISENNLNSNCTSCELKWFLLQISN